MGLKQLCLGRINHGILAKGGTTSIYTKYFMYVYSHMKVYVTDRSLCNEEYILARVVGEEFADFLPQQTRIVEESAARLEFAGVVRGTLKSVKAANPDFSACFPEGLKYENYEQNEEFKIGYTEGSELKKFPDPFERPADFRTRIRDLLEFNNKKADVGAMFGIAYDIVLMLAIMMAPARVNLPMELTFLTFVTFAKKGLAGEDYVKKVETVITEELQIDVKLNESLIKKLWKHFEPHMSADMMRHCVKSTIAQLPKGSVRLRILVEQCEWYGLTCYRAVKQAMDLKGFPWGRLTAIAEYQSEMKAFEEAAQEVGDNAFYGYNQSMGKAKSARYKNLASVCAKALVETEKNLAFDKAACFTQGYPSKRSVDAIISEYVSQRASSSKKSDHGQSKTAKPTLLAQTSTPKSSTSKPAGASKHTTPSAMASSTSQASHHKSKPPSSMEDLRVGDIERMIQSFNMFIPEIPEYDQFDFGFDPLGLCDYDSDDTDDDIHDHDRYEGYGDSDYD